MTVSRLGIPSEQLPRSRRPSQDISPGTGKRRPSVASLDSAHSSRVSCQDVSSGTGKRRPSVASLDSAHSGIASCQDPDSECSLASSSSLTSFEVMSKSHVALSRASYHEARRMMKKLRHKKQSKALDGREKMRVVFQSAVAVARQRGIVRFWQGEVAGSFLAQQIRREEAFKTLMKELDDLCTLDEKVEAWTSEIDSELSERVKATMKLVSDLQNMVKSLKQEVAEGKSAGSMAKVQCAAQRLSHEGTKVIKDLREEQQKNTGAAPSLVIAALKHATQETIQAAEESELIAPMALSLKEMLTPPQRCEEQELKAEFTKRLQELQEKRADEARRQKETKEEEQRPAAEAGTSPHAQEERSPTQVRVLSYGSISSMDTSNAGDHHLSGDAGDASDGLPWLSAASTTDTVEKSDRFGLLAQVSEQGPESDEEDHDADEEASACAAESLEVECEVMPDCAGIEDSEQEASQGAGYTVIQVALPQVPEVDETRLASPSPDSAKAKDGNSLRRFRSGASRSFRSLVGKTTSESSVVSVGRLWPPRGWRRVKRQQPPQLVPVVPDQPADVSQEVATPASASSHAPPRPRMARLKAAFASLRSPSAAAQPKALNITEHEGDVNSPKEEQQPQPHPQPSHLHGPKPSQLPRSPCPKASPQGGPLLPPLAAKGHESRQPLHGKMQDVGFADPTPCCSSLPLGRIAPANRLPSLAHPLPSPTTTAELKVSHRRRHSM